MPHSISSPTTGAEADVDRDGDVDASDYTQAGTTYSSGLSKGELSLKATTDNQIGWSGYIYDQPVRLHCVRFRYFDTTLMRWINRDPAGYVDSMNLYGYGSGNPIGVVDPFGLDDEPPPLNAVPVRAIDLEDSVGPGIGFGEGYSPKSPYELREIWGPVYPWGIPEFPTFGDAPVYKDPIEAFHTGLDLAGSIPGLGEPFDGANGILYALDGEWELAAISILSMFFFGEYLKGGKYSAKLAMSEAVEEAAEKTLTLHQKHRLAKSLGNIPLSSQPIRQGTSRNGTKWWEYVDSDGKTRIVIEHTDGSVHQGFPKPQSCHGDGFSEPKYYDGGTGHVGE